MKKIVFVALIASLALPLYAQNLGKKIPVIGSPTMKLDCRTASLARNSDMFLCETTREKAATHTKDKSQNNESGAKIGETEISDITQTLKEIRTNICSVLQKEDEFKFTMAWDASAKIWGIGAGTSSGLEVTIKCK